MAKKTLGHFETTLRSQDAFDSYIVVLTFTLLAAAVQSAKLGQWLPADIVEWAGWVTLLGAGLMGLKRLEEKPRFYHSVEAGDIAREEIEELKELLDEGMDDIRDPKTGKSSPLKILIPSKELQVRMSQTRSSKRAKRLPAMYQWQRGLFVLGLILEICSRAMPQIHCWVTRACVH
jgi:hypothetical protein